MDQEVGNQLSKFGSLHNVYGSTEAGWIGCGLETTPDSWDYLCLKSDDPGVEFRETESGSGLYELILKRTPESEAEQAVWYTFPELDEWNTKDLWHKHPTKPGHWFYEGRADDLIVYYGGAKFNPLGMEEQIREHPSVRYAIVAGSNRNQSALLVELSDDAKSLPYSKAVERVWPAVEAANAVAPKHALIAKTHIIFEQPDKPLERTGKGTVQRLPTLRKYERELDELYAREGNVKLGGTLAKALSRDGAVRAPGAPVVDSMIDSSSDDGETGPKPTKQQQNGQPGAGAVSGAKKLVQRGMSRIGLHSA